MPKRPRKFGGTRCSAWNCGKSKLRDNVCVFKFPDREKSPQRFEYWVSVVSRTKPDFVFKPRSSCLCAHHFDPDQFDPKNLGQICEICHFEVKNTGDRIKMRWGLVKNARPNPDLMPLKKRTPGSGRRTESELEAEVRAEVYRKTTAIMSAAGKLNRKRVIEEAVAAFEAQERQKEADRLEVVTKFGAACKRTFVNPPINGNSIYDDLPFHDKSVQADLCEYVRHRSVRVQVPQKKKMVSVGTGTCPLPKYFMDKYHSFPKENNIYITLAEDEETGSAESEAEDTEDVNYQPDTSSDDH